MIITQIYTDQSKQFYHELMGNLTDFQKFPETYLDELKTNITYLDQSSIITLLDVVQEDLTSCLKEIKELKEAGGHYLTWSNFDEDGQMDSTSIISDELKDELIKEPILEEMKEILIGEIEFKGKKIKEIKA